MRFCIIGTGRCGSTLLRNLMNLHPDVFVFNETHWIPKMYEAFGGGTGHPDTLVSIVERTLHVTGLPVTPVDGAELRRQFSDTDAITVKQFCDRLGGAFAAEAGKQTWADKTPDYGPHMELLQRLWPECRFVHIVRDPAEVVSSMAQHPGYRWLAAASEVWWCPPSFNNYHSAVEIEDRPLEDFVTLWQLRMARIQDELGRLRPGSFIEIGFDALIRSTEQTLRDVATFLGMPQPESWLRAASGEVEPGRPRSGARAEVIELFN